jgi:hypothetical protein
MADAELFDLIKTAGLFITAVTAGVGAYLGSYLKKKGENLATHEDVHKLVEQVSAVTVATKQIEARIDRASRVHERQLDILQRLYRHLHDAQGFLMRMTAVGRRANEITPEEYEPIVAKAMDAAREELLNGRLFIPLALVQQCEGFFEAVFEGQRDFALAHLLAIDPAKRAEFWSAAAKVAHQQVPKILQQIDEAARALIHGEAT